MDSHMFNDELVINTLLSVYTREVERGDTDNMRLITNKLLTIPTKLIPSLELITETLITCFKLNNSKASHDAIIDFLNHLKEQLPDHPQLIDKALAECSALAINERADDSMTVNRAVESFKRYAEQVEGDLKNTYRKKHADALMLKADAEYKKGNFDAALADYQEVFASAGYVLALSKAAGIQSDRVDEYQAAIENYTLLSQNPEAQHSYSLMHEALINLKKMFDDLPEKHPKKSSIRELMYEILNITLSSHVSSIHSLSLLNEYYTFAEVANNDPGILSLLQEIKEHIESAAVEVPPPPPPSTSDADAVSSEPEVNVDADRLQFVEKRIEETKNSSLRHLETLVGFLTSEKDNEEIMLVVNKAINAWMEHAVKVDRDGHVFLKDERGIIQLSKTGNLAASYYLARHLAQDGKFQMALSLCARIAMSSINNQDQSAETVKKLSVAFIDECANQRVGSGIGSSLLSKQTMILTAYAKDLREIVNTPPMTADPDQSIEAVLFERDVGPESSYQKYIFDIGTLGLKADIAKPLRASERKQNIPGK